MGALKPSSNAMVHKKRIDLENKDGKSINLSLPHFTYTLTHPYALSASELEPLVDERNTREDKTHIFKDEFNTEYQKKFRPFSQYEYSEGRFTKRAGQSNEDHDELAHTSLPPQLDKNDSWYREVVELRKKAGEYKVRHLNR